MGRLTGMWPFRMCQSILYLSASNGNPVLDLELQEVDVDLVHILVLVTEVLIVRVDDVPFFGRADQRKLGRRRSELETVDLALVAIEECRIGARSGGVPQVVEDPQDLKAGRRVR